MVQQHRYYHHVVRQRVGLASTPRFRLQVGVPTFGIHLGVCGSGALYGGVCVTLALYLTVLCLVVCLCWAMSKLVAHFIPLSLIPTAVRSTRCSPSIARISLKW